MPENVVRFADYEKRSKQADAVSPRDPCDAAVVIILPVVRRFDPTTPPHPVMCADGHGSAWADWPPY